MRSRSRADTASSGTGFEQDDLRALCDRYGLQQSPFLEAPDRFYAGGQRQHYLDSLRHLCSFGGMLLVVSGNAGSGRSRLLAEFQRTEQQALNIQRFTPEQCGSTEALAAALWARIRQPRPETPSAAAIESFFQAPFWQRSSGKRWVLLLDDADQCPPEVISALVAGFASGDRTRAPVPLLVGAPEFARKLQEADPEAAEWIHILTLRPLDQAESRQFIEQCLAWAGIDPAGVIDQHRGERLHQLAGGNFGQLKRVAPSVILGRGGPAQPAAPARPARVRKGALWVVLAVLLLGVSYGLVSWQYQGPSQPGPDPESAAEPVPTADPTGPESADGNDEVARLREAMAEAERRLNRGEENPGPAAEAPAQSPAPVEAPVELAPGMPPLLPESLSLSPLEAIAAVTNPENVPAPDGSAEAEPEGEAAALATEETLPAAELAQNDVPASTPEPEPEPVFSPSAPGIYRDRAWVGNLPDEYLTIQLLGSYNEQTAVDLIRRYPGRNYFYVRSTYRGERWFVVLAGVYEDSAQARAALARLPRSLQRSGPWVRDVGGL